MFFIYIFVFRLEYDAYRNDLEELMQTNQGSMSSKAEEARKNFLSHKERYEKLRSDVAIKMKFLDENKVIFFSNSDIDKFCH